VTDGKPVVHGGQVDLADCCGRGRVQNFMTLPS
jgi:hypothetical protein